MKGNCLIKERDGDQGIYYCFYCFFLTSGDLMSDYVLIEIYFYEGSGFKLLVLVH